MVEATDIPIVGALEHLTGRCRGQFSWLTADEALAWWSPDTPFRITGPGGTVDRAQVVARFRRVTDGFEISATEACPLWINRQPVETATLSHGDMIEFGEDGPLSRLRVYSDRHRPEPTVGAILSDTGSYLRASRRPLPVRLVRAFGGTLNRALFQTTVLFRVMVLLILCAMVGLLYLQWRTDQTLIADVDRQVAALASDLARGREEALRPSDLAALREDLSGSLDANRARLEELESERQATTQVITGAQGAVVFLQASYGLRHRATGQLLRHQVGIDGLPAITPSGRPRFTLDGDGPVADAKITGTGFLVRGTDRLITNRHVALPWEEDGDDAPQELEPVMLRFQAWFPGHPDPVAVTTLAASDQVDLAMLGMASVPGGVTGLEIAQAPSAPGEAIVVMGYPTGLRSLLAQAGAQFIAGLETAGVSGFWDIAAQLAEAELIAPLSTRGIIGRVSGPTMVYDAETTSGGSGGPVLNMSGAVVAVNTAIIPEFGGSNLGVPAEHIRALLAQVTR